MSSKGGFSLEGMKAEFGRFTHKIKEKIGKGDETVDIEYNHVAERFKKTKKDLKNLKTSSDKILQGLKELNKSFGIFTESLVGIFPPDQPSHHIILQLQRAMNGLDACRQAFDDSWKEDFLIPLSGYMSFYVEASKRIDERERRRVDLDRFRDDLKEMSEKPPKDANKLPLAKEKMYQQQEAFKDANAELIHDLPILIADAPKFLEPIVGTVVNGFSTYYAGCANSVREVVPNLGHLPKGAVEAHLNRVLMTPKETSAIYKPISSYLPAAQAKMQEKAAQAAQASAQYNPNNPGGGQYQPQGAAPAYPPPYGGAPPAQGGYPSPGGYGAPPAQGYGAPSAQAGYGAPPAQGGYGAPPTQGGYSAPAAAPAGYHPPNRAPSGTVGSSPVAGRGLPAPGGRGGPPPGPPPGQIRARGLYAFAGGDPSELPFNVGDILIIHSQQGAWWDAELNGKRGHIPSNYVELIK